MTKKASIVSLLFILIGIFFISLRVSYTGALLFPKINNNFWKVVVRVVPNSQFSKGKIEITVPSNSSGFQIVEESFLSNGYAAGITRSKGKRNLIWRGTGLSNDGKYPGYSAVIKRGIKNIKIPSGILKYANATSVFRDKELPQVRELLTAARKYKKDLKALAKFFKKCVQEAGCDGVEITNRLRKSEELTAIAIAELLRKSRVNALAASGFSVLGADKSSVKRFWVNVLGKDKSFNVYPKTANSFKAKNLIFWSWEYPTKKKSKAQESSKIVYTIAPFDSQLKISSKDHQSNAWRYFSLRNLPAPTQATYRAMLLVPLGALVMSFFRSFLGFQTFGTFMPVLFALSFLDMGLGWGLVLLSFIVTFGVIVRSLLNSLQLLMVPRLATTLSLVVVLVLLLSKLSFELGFSEGLSVTLFPIIILTMIVERVSISWDEVGAKATISLFIYSILASILCYLVISPDLVQYWLFSFPEVTLIFIGLSIALGRYTGYRLVEFSRFKVFG